MAFVIQLVFWCSFFGITYTYGIYWLILFVVSRFVRRRRKVDPSLLPRVSFVVAAYNEQDAIDQKLHNCLAFEYPKERIEFLFGSDGSTDRTDEKICDAAAQHPGLRFFRFQAREGKAAVLNRLVPESRGEVLVFSDANTLYRPDAVRCLVGHFADPVVGGVCGNLVLVQPDRGPGGLGEILYWNFENTLKRMEGAIRTVFGGTGGIYAIRKPLFRPLPKNRTNVGDDFLIPIRVVEQGFDMVYEEHAVAEEPVSFSMQGELERKVRIGTADMFSLAQIAGLLRPRTGFVAFGLWSHKVLRWMAPFFMILAFTASALLSDRSFFRWAFTVQAVWYALAASVWIVDRAGLHAGGLSVFVYPVLSHAALLVGYVRFFTRSSTPAWNRSGR